MIQDGLGLLIEDPESPLDRLVMDVVEAILVQGTAADAFGEDRSIGAIEVADEADVGLRLHEFRLGDAARDAIEHEIVLIWPEFSHDRQVPEVLLPEAYREVIGHEVASGGIGYEFSPQFRARIE